MRYVLGIALVAFALVGCLGGARPVARDATVRLAPPRPRAGTTRPPSPHAVLVAPPLVLHPTVEDLADQLAARAFKTRRGVCAHYAALLASLGEAAGEELPYVRGDAHLADGTVGKHAWNLAKLEGRVEPIDVTWDSGYDDPSGVFHHRYSDDWLFVPSEEFKKTHTPDRG